MFRDRKDAGEKLAQKLSQYANDSNSIILALPRGGVPVAYEIAQKLNLPLDVFLVRKLGIPDSEETAMGAIASGGIVILSENLINYLNISNEEVQKVIAKEQKELEYRGKLYHENYPSLKLAGRKVILVDDGIATGSTMQVAVVALRKNEVSEIIIAVPVSSDSAYEELSTQVDHMICLEVPQNFNAVGQWYENFSQVSHEEVKELLKKSAKEVL